MEQKTNRVNVRVTDTLKRKVDKKLREDGITMTDLLTACLMQYVGIAPNVDKVLDDCVNSNKDE